MISVTGWWITAGQSAPPEQSLIATNVVLWESVSKWELRLYKGGNGYENVRSHYEKEKWR